MVNTQLLKEKMKQEGKSTKCLASSLNIAAPTMSQKINNVRPMYLDEALVLVDVLHIDMSEFGAYFFVKEIA